MITLNPETYQYYLLAVCLWREARNQNYDAQCAVVQSILNRARHPSWWGNSISSVIGYPKQYSSMTDPGDKQLTRWPDASDRSFQLCLQVVEDVAAGRAQDFARGATHFYSVDIPPPYWALSAEFIAQYGAMRFFRAA